MKIKFESYTAAAREHARRLDENGRFHEFWVSFNILKDSADDDYVILNHELWSKRSDQKRRRDVHLYWYLDHRYPLFCSAFWLVQPHRRSSRPTLHNCLEHLKHDKVIAQQHTFTSFHLFLEHIPIYSFFDQWITAKSISRTHKPSAVCHLVQKTQPDLGLGFGYPLA